MKYLAKSTVSVSLVLDSGASLHVSFSPLTGGGSVFYTDNPVVQRGLERHPKYGKLFKAVVEDKPAPVTETKEEPVKKEGPQEVKVSCLDDAKEYLVDRFGISRTKLRYASNIKKAAEERGIVFLGI